MKLLISLCVVTGAALEYLMSVASSNNTAFAQNYQLLLLVGGGLAVGLMALIGYQLVLLRQYRLTVGTVYQNFTRFDEVTRVLSRLRGWHIADKGALKKDQVYQAAVRMRLDTAQLPKPFQLNAIASRDWTLASEWHRWTITP